MNLVRVCILIGNLVGKAIFIVENLTDNPTIPLLKRTVEEVHAANSEYILSFNKAEEYSNEDVVIKDNNPMQGKPFLKSNQRMNNDY